MDFPLTERHTVNVHSHETAPLSYKYLDQFLGTYIAYFYHQLYDANESILCKQLNGKPTKNF